MRRRAPRVRGFKMDSPKFIPFHQVKVNIPRKYILKRLAKEDYLTFKESVKLGRKWREIDRAIMRLRHAQSVVEKCLLKRKDVRSRYLK